MESERKMKNTRSYNVGTSDYATHRYQVWDIWRDFQLNPWEADIIKRLLRKKDGEENDIEKIKHILNEMIDTNQYEWNMAESAVEMIQHEYKLSNQKASVLRNFLLDRFHFKKLTLVCTLERIEKLESGDEQ